MTSLCNTLTMRSLLAPTKSCMFVDGPPCSTSGRNSSSLSPPGLSNHFGVLGTQDTFSGMQYRMQKYNKERGLRCTATLEFAPMKDVGSSHEYNQMMKRQMANPYEYHHDLGMYYTRITDNLIVGSQPQWSGDIDRLHSDESVNCVLNLQQDHDIQYWGIDINSITHRCHQLNIQHHRRPARDFDPHSLRNELPRMVAVIRQVINKGETVYVHCTAGLGRAPAAAIAYMFWFHNIDLGTAYHHVTSLRPCGPKRDAIRGATYDLAKNSDHQPPFDHLPNFAFEDVAPWERQLIQDRVHQHFH